MKLILAPVCMKDHWSLIAIYIDESKKQIVKYFDSLQILCEQNLQLAQSILQTVRPDLKDQLNGARANAAKQPAGTAVCGCYVLHWMEQLCRHVIKNESPRSLGWPCFKAWSDKLMKLMKALADTQHTLKADAEKATAKEVKAAAKAKSLAAKALKATKSKAIVEDLKKDAEAAFKAIPASKPCFENLSSAAKAEVEHVRLSGIGVCSKCHWKSGCFKCSGDKALQYWLKKEFPDAA